MADELTITFDLHATGCLPGLLQREIGAAEKLLLNCAPSAHDDVTTYIEQLHRCRAAVVAARNALISEALRKAMPG